MNNKALFTSDKNYWETPKELFEQLNNEFHFTLDPCSTHENAKCDKHYTEEDNGLIKNWEGETVFCNPPYGRTDTGKWVKKCYEESLKPNTLVVMLIPSRTDTKWFHEYIYKKQEIRFIKGRLKFEINGKKRNTATFPSMIVVFNNKGE